MTKKYDIPPKMPRYLKRLVMEYRKRGEGSLADVLEGSKFEVREETGYDNWDGGMDGHDLLLLVPDELMGNIPLDNQQEIQSQIRKDLNKAASAAQNEFINDVHIEYLEDSDNDAKNLKSLGSVSEIPSKDLNLWKPHTIKLFISHRDSCKEQAHKLANKLSRFGISSFVAHDSIEPDEDWQKEIEKALQSMDALLAFITDEFFNSAWTNQEIGFALARGIPIISIKLEATDPAGFIRNRQAIKGSSKAMTDNAKMVFETIEKRLGHSIKYRISMIARFTSASSFDLAKTAFEPVSRMTGFSDDELEKLITAYNTNSQISNCFALNQYGKYLSFLNKHSSKKLIMSSGKIVVTPETDDQIPF